MLLSKEDKWLEFVDNLMDEVRGKVKSSDSKWKINFEKIPEMSKENILVFQSLQKDLLKYSPKRLSIIEDTDPSGSFSGNGTLFQIRLKDSSLHGKKLFGSIPKEALMPFNLI